MRCFGQVLPLGGSKADPGHRFVSDGLGMPRYPNTTACGSGGERGGVLGSSAEIDKYWINGLTITIPKLLCAAYNVYLEQMILIAFDIV